MDRLFVYGIFLDEDNRAHYGMSMPEYAVIPDFLTVERFSSIVEAIYAPGLGISLTGLLCDIDPEYWERLDQLEAGYDRIIVTTVDGDDCYMYVQKGTQIDG